MGENDEPRNRWKYHGAVQESANDEHVANVPLPHLIYGCELEAKGKRFRVTPREPEIHRWIETGATPSCYACGRPERPGPSMADSHNTSTRGQNGRLWWSILAELLDPFVTTTTEKDQGTLHPYTFPTGMAAHAGRRNNGAMTHHLDGGLKKYR